MGDLLSVAALALLYHRPSCGSMSSGMRLKRLTNCDRRSREKDGPIGSVWYWSGARLQSWLHDMGSFSSRPRNYMRLIAHAVGWLIVLYLLVGATTAWENGAGHGSLVVDVLAQVAWTSFAIAQVVLIVIVILAIRHYVISKRT